MPRYTLGINPCVRGTGRHDPSSALFADRDLVFAAEEERFNRIKHSERTFPRRAVKACLNEADIDLGSVDQVLVPWSVDLSSRQIDPTYLRDIIRSRDDLGRRVALIGFRYYLSLRPESVVDSIRGELASLGEGSVPPIETYGHHKSHAASAFHPSDFDDALVVTLDGKGEYDSTVVWKGAPSGLERIETFKAYNSLGAFYGAVTEFLGYRANNGEGKIMGLAPYGKRNPDIESELRSVIDVGADYDLTALTAGGISEGADRLTDLFDRERSSGDGFTQWEKDLARTTQALLEETVTALVREHIGPVGSQNVCLAGGVALNCKMNKRIVELDEVKNVFIQPVANDAGAALGAGYLQFRPDEVSEQQTAYMGSSFKDGEIAKTLELNKVPYTEPKSVEREVAERLADGELVGWFSGRMEMGPRALGNRSILADPRTEASRDRVNKYVKHREEWRPFAPSMHEDAAERYLVNGTSAPFMIKTFDTRKSKRDEIAAVVHEGDNTTRPQTVREDQNPRYYQLIEAFEDITGVPVLLNTSFNDHGEPIVRTPQEALKDFFGMGLDTLVLGPYLVEKQARSN